MVFGTVTELAQKRNGGAVSSTPRCKPQMHALERRAGVS